MSRFTDTSVVVRYLTADPPDQAEQAALLIETAEKLYLTETVLVETGHVLRRLYGMAREDIASLLIRLIQRRNIAVRGLDKTDVITAIRLTGRSGRVSLPDGLIWAAATSDPPAIVYSFDRRFPADGIEVQVPGQGAS